MVKRLRSDNDSEYVSKSFEDFCNDRGIKHEPTIPRSLQQNGIAARINRTLVETTQAMLHQAQKLLKLWVEAVSTACYIRNESATKFFKNVTSL